jgi:predicted DCC family thiol-disulfide oxidoreductase YuxK
VSSPIGSDRHPVVLFDGVCNLCDRTVQFIIDHDPAARFRFAAQQSTAGAALLAEHGIPVGQGTADSVILVDGAKVLTDSTAVLRILAGFAGPWRFVGMLRIVPRPIRDVVYRIVARYRYRWFGRADECRIPTPELRARFLDD